MIGLFSCASRPRIHPQLLSSPIGAKMSKEKVEMSTRGEETEGRTVVGSVVRRRARDVVEEMAKIAEVDRARMTAPAPPAPVFAGGFRYSQRRPRPHRKPINPVPPPSTEELRVAAVRQREFEAREAHLLEEARRIVSRPRTPTPPRKEDDHYDLARWSVRRWK